ncbi:hypothetical protein CEXT_623681 [Caerostris extrusa]|uniref:Uncharacterized protein n=1 Tax=Caerostris extrusa TaxID=172846 RepID=A0AAV4PMK4_CAEEX|nr:hypothetical protein CEXT_623681 [Caerostris extrusa]
MIRENCTQQDISTPRCPKNSITAPIRKHAQHPDRRLPSFSWDRHPDSSINIRGKTFKGAVYGLSKYRMDDYSTLKASRVFSALTTFLEKSHTCPNSGFEDVSISRDFLLLSPNKVTQL